MVAASKGASTGGAKFLSSVYKGFRMNPVMRIRCCGGWEFMFRATAGEMHSFAIPGMVSVISWIFGISFAIRTALNHPTCDISKLIPYDIKVDKETPADWNGGLDEDPEKIPYSKLFYNDNRIFGIPSVKFLDVLDAEAKKLGREGVAAQKQSHDLVHKFVPSIENLLISQTEKRL
eukprot:NODE_8261_length_695_cov_26.643357_g7639_i0.p1 GENE.NODE_8261_length_695_cov_26.643357_g7639_i0~~NODE_8261_length_695_cov_26.643357_g7639_i0.p1  ORF type:complete len:199 (-),score=40.29 NODE_8261_length_695_cov_26.643357_g7639_i0:97-624(-)